MSRIGSPLILLTLSRIHRIHRIYRIRGLRSGKILSYPVNLEHLEHPACKSCLLLQAHFFSFLRKNVVIDNVNDGLRKGASLHQPPSSNASRTTKTTKNKDPSLPASHTVQ